MSGLELNLRSKPRKRLVREKPAPLTVPKRYNHERPTVALGVITPKQQLSMAAQRGCPE